MVVQVAAGFVATWYFALHMISGAPGEYRSKSQVVFFNNKAGCERVLARVKNFGTTGVEYHKRLTDKDWSEQHSHFWTKTCRKMPTKLLKKQAGRAV